MVRFTIEQLRAIMDNQ
jgi:elongation factor 2